MTDSTLPLPLAGPSALSSASQPLEYRTVLFYLPTSAWLVDRPPETPLFTAAAVATWAAKLGTPAFGWKNSQFEFRACQGGLCELRIFDHAWPDNDKVLAIDSIVESHAAYLAPINAFCFLLDCSLIETSNFGFIELSEVRHQDICFARVDADGTIKSRRLPQSDSSSYRAQQMRQIVAQFGHFMQLAFQYCTLDQASTLLLCSPDQCVPKYTIGQVELTLACERLGILLPNAFLIKAYSDIAKAVAQHKQADFDLSIALSWFVIERTLTKHWRAYLESNREANNGEKRINSERMEFLRSGRDFTASIVSNYLELCGELPLQILQKVDKVRKKRNAVVHERGNSKSTLEDSAYAISTAVEYLAMRGGILLSPNLGFSTNF